MSKLRTAESVSPQHPDKICDRVADAVLDAYLRVDKDARTAIEVVGGHGRLLVFGEISSRKHPDVTQVVRRIVGPELKIDIRLDEQSAEIARGVDSGGAGDQGIMIGYATDQTDELLPLEVILARRLNQHLYHRWPYDGKTQVTIDERKIVAIVASFQNTTVLELETAVRDWLRTDSLARSLSPADDYRLFANPAGEWRIGGFDADAGLTGRKLVVDNYGPNVPIGGGSFSGKDATKVDRSGAYMARKIARDYLRKYRAHKVLCRLAYAIGYSEPLEATVIVDGESIAVTGYDLSPRGISDFLDLRRPIYQKTAEYGHFGHAEFTWEQ